MFAFSRKTNSNDTNSFIDDALSADSDDESLSSSSEGSSSSASSSSSSSEDEDEEEGERAESEGLDSMDESTMDSTTAKGEDRYVHVQVKYVLSILHNVPFFMSLLPVQFFSSVFLRENYRAAVPMAKVKTGLSEIFIKQNH